MKRILMFGKAAAILLIVAMTAGTLGLWFQTYLVGAYYAHSGIALAIIVGASPLFLGVAAVWAVFKIINLKLDDIVGESSS